MKISLVGATGGSGRALLEEALARGLTIKALVRHPTALSTFGDRIQIVQGDVRDPQAVRRAVEGVTAVLSALGTGRNLEPTTVMSEGTAAIVEAMAATGVRRLLVMTSGMVTPTGNEPLLFRTFGKYLLRHVHADHLRLEEVVRASSLEWTIVRPPKLLDGPARGGYRLARDAGVPGGNELTRADLAQFMLDEADKCEYLRAGVMLGY